MIRMLPLAAGAMLGACSAERGGEAAKRPPATADERRVEVAQGRAGRVAMRTGPSVPVTLPKGFTLFPGAQVVENTVVERRGRRHVLLHFTVDAPPGAVVAHYRAQARAARARLTLDLGGSGAASLGGTLADGQRLSVSARAGAAGSQVAVAID